MKNILSILLRRHPTAPKSRPMIVPAPEVKLSRNSKYRARVTTISLLLIAAASIAYLELVYFSNVPHHHGYAVSAHEHGINLLKNGNSADAVNYFQDLLRADPKSISLRINLAVSLKSVGKDNEAERLFQQVLREQPRNIAALNNYGTFLFHKQRWDEAETVFTKAVTIDETSLEATLNLGIVQETANKYSAAMKSYDKALMLNGLSPEKQKEVSERVRQLQAVAFSKQNLGDKL